MSRKLSPASSLESIKQEARRRHSRIKKGDARELDRLRAAYPDCRLQPVLRDVQHALALEHDFTSWVLLKQHLGSIQTATPIFAFLARSEDPTYRIHAGTKTISLIRSPLNNELDALVAETREHGLRTLRANGHLTNTALKQISGLSSLIELEMGNSSDLSEDGYRALSDMPQLRNLSLGGPLTDGALSFLGNLKELRTFQMCWQTGISDAGLQGLGKCAHLENVDLMGSTCGDGVVRALVGKPELRKFKTGRNVTDAGLRYFTDYPMFNVWCGETPKYRLMEANASPTQLTIDGPFTDAGVGSMGTLDGLFALSFFWHTPNITEHAIGHLAIMPRLGMLGMDGKICSDAMLAGISRLPNLKMLLTQGAAATDQGFEALTKAPMLEYIWGRECPNFTGKGLVALAKLRTLKGIAISLKRVSDSELAALPAFPDLRELMPMDVPDEGFKHIGNCNRLERLWCMYCRDTGDTATAHISRLNRLKSYYAGATQITNRSMAVLASISSLQSVDLWKCESVSEEGVAKLAVLPKLKSLQLNGMPNVSAAVAEHFLKRVRVVVDP